MNYHALQILIAEDDLDFRECVVEELIRKGHEVRVTSNGKEAIESLKSLSLPDIVLLDMSMPVMDGRETLRTIRESNEMKDLPVVLLSGSDKDVSYECGYLLKPFTLEQLEEEISSCLKRRLLELNQESPRMQLRSL